MENDSKYTQILIEIALMISNFENDLLPLGLFNNVF